MLSVRSFFQTKTHKGGICIRQTLLFMARLSKLLPVCDKQQTTFILRELFIAVDFFVIFRKQFVEQLNKKSSMSFN